MTAKDLMQQALEAFECPRCGHCCNALHERPEQQEPVAWMYHGIRHDGTPHDRPTLVWRPEYMDALSSKMGAVATPLYTAHGITE